MGNIKNTLINLMRLFFWGVLRKGLTYTSPKLIPLVEAILAKGTHKLMRHRRLVIQEEMMKSYGNKWNKDKIDRSVRESFLVYVGFHVKNVYLSKLKSSNIERYIPVEGIHHLDKALENGKGTILLNPHFGPYLLIMPALGHRGYKIHQIALHGNDTPGGRRTWLDQKVYDIKFANIQGKMLAEFINVGQKTSIRKGIDVLKRNEILLFPPTGRGGLEWVKVRLMNRTALLNTGAVKLGMMTGAALIPVFVVHGKPFARLIIEKTLEVKDKSVEEVLQEYADIFSRYVEEYPHHFGNYLLEMAINSHWDDHPFFASEEGR